MKTEYQQRLVDDLVSSLEEATRQAKRNKMRGRAYLTPSQAVMVRTQAEQAARYANELIGALHEGPL